MRNAIGLQDPSKAGLLASRLAGLALALVLASSAGFAVQAPDTSEPTLSLDPSRIAVRGISLEALASEGIASDAVHPWPIAGWSLADVPGTTAELTPQQRAARVSGLVERLAAGGGDGYATPVFVGLDEGPVIPRPVIVAGFESSVDPSASRASLESFDALEVMAEDWAGMPGTFLLRARLRSGDQVLSLAEQLADLPGVRFSEPSMIFTGHGGHTPNDPGFPDCWGLDNTGQSGGTVDMDMNGPEAWDVTTGDSSISVVIIDTGVQQDHPDIGQIGGVDLTSDGPGNGGPVNAFDNHGTAVAGCVSATIDNSLGTVGVAPGCPSASARTFIAIDAAGNWTSVDTWTVDALSFAESIGARVTNNSNFYGWTATSIADKYQQTRDAGIVHFAGAGNSSTGSADYPASLPSVAAIAAIDRDGTLATFSNFGPDIAFAAPGVDIYSTDRTGADGYDAAGDYAYVNGTSFASPYAAGVAALLLSWDPALDPGGVLTAMRQGAKDLGAAGFDSTFGWGLPDARAALEIAGGCPDPTSYCSTSPNSVGSGAVISWTGTPSPATDEFHLVATGCPANKSLVFYYGGTTASLPFGNGLRCVGGGIFRLPVVSTDASGAADLMVDFSQPPAGGGPGEWLPGDTWYCQGWYRDPAGGGASFNLTDGLEVQVCAGAGGPEGMVPIPAGTFEMGRHVGGGLLNELPLHDVTLDAFYMDEYEVSNAEYVSYLNTAYAQGRVTVTLGYVYQVGGANQVLAETTASSIYSRITWDGSAFGVTLGHDLHPVTEVSWYGACTYANQRSRDDGLTPCYDETSWDCNFASDGYRLPTEAEWEYAARGGEHSPYYRYPWGNTLDGSKANYAASGDPYEAVSFPHTTPVGYYDGNQSPSGVDMVNGYGLYDMSGNVQEWCWDWWSPSYYSSSPPSNPTGPVSGSSRVIRGGSWSFGPSFLRCAHRYSALPIYRNYGIGFRVVTARP